MTATTHRLAASDRAITALERLPELAAVSCFVGYFPDGQRPDRAVDYVIPYDLHPLLIVLENRAGVACSVFRREVFDCVHYDEALTSYEDWELWWQLAEANLPVEVMPMLLYRYRRRENSMVRTTGASSHVQLLSAIASRHVDHLRRYGDLVFRYHLAKIQELRQAAPRRSKPLPWRATAMLRRVCSGMKGL